MKSTMKFIVYIMSGGNSRKFLRGQCEIQSSRDNLGEQNFLKKHFSGFQGA